MVNEIYPDGTVVHLEDPLSPERLKGNYTGVTSQQQGASRVKSSKQNGGNLSDVGIQSNAPNIARARDASMSTPPSPQQRGIDQDTLDPGSRSSGKAETTAVNGDTNMASTRSSKRGADPPQPMSSPKMAKVEPVSLHREKTRIHFTDQGITIIDDPEQDDINQVDGTPQKQWMPEPSTTSAWQAFAATESLPVKPSTASNGEPQQSLSNRNNPTTSTSPTLAGLKKLRDTATFQELVGPEAATAIESLHMRLLASPGKRLREYGNVDCGMIDRAARTKIHQALRDVYDSALESNTDNNGHLIVTPASSHGNRPAGKSDRDEKVEKRQTDRASQYNQRGFQAMGKRMWEDLGGDYLHFSLYKENKDTMEVISYLARVLHTKPASFQFAGTKDRRGVTVQRVSVYRQQAERLKSLNKGLRNAEVGSFAYHPTQLQLGDLAGNQFIITLRDCRFDSDSDHDATCPPSPASTIINTAVSSLQNNGFINYYGLQRFGSFGIRTDAVGLLMLQGNFKAAVDAILAYSDASLGDDNNMGNESRTSRDDRARAQAIRDFYKNGKVRSVLELLPRKFSAEAALIQFLGNPRNAGDFLGAIMKIHRNSRLMYMHAYQSLVWNVVASERWRRWGAEVKPGDLVLVREHEAKVKGPAQATAYDADGDVVIQAGSDDRSTTFEETITRARGLTAEEAASGGYSIFDVVLPTPGYDILYPNNEIGEYYATFMASERGGGLDPHNMRRRWVDMSLTGSYRKLLARPAGGVSAEVKTYINENQKFVETDLERLRKSRDHQHRLEIQTDDAKNKLLHTEAAMKDGDEELGGEAEDEPRQRVNPAHTLGSGIAELGKIFDDTQMESKIAIVLRLRLAGGQYATMALRELMRGGVDTYKPDFSGGR